MNISKKEESKKLDTDKKNLSKQDAAMILGVDIDADEYEIENAYTKKAMSMRNRNDAQALSYIEKINIAYDIMRGYETYDINYGKHIAGKSTKQWKNIWDYGKYPLLGFVLLLIFIIFLLYDASKRNISDFVVGIFGDFSENVDPLKQKEAKLYTNIREQNKEIVNPRFSFNNISIDIYGKLRGDATIQASMANRMIMETGAEKYDVLLLDNYQYEILAMQGVLAPLDDLAVKLINDNPSLYHDYVKPLKINLDTEVLPEKFANNEYIYGFDLSKGHIMNNLEVVGNSHILAISAHTKQEQSAKSVIYNLICTINDWNIGKNKVLNPIELDPNIDQIG